MEKAKDPWFVRLVDRMADNGEWMTNHVGWWLTPFIVFCILVSLVEHVLK